MKAILYSGISRRFVRVWERDLSVYRKTWRISFIPPLLEPLFYLVAFGVGLSALVGRLIYHGSEVSYVAFIAPGLLAVNIMYNAFFENTYSSFVRMYFQKTYDAILATPLSLEEIITGEIVWGATKSVIAAGLMMVVLGAFGLVSMPLGLCILPLALLGGIAFGSIGMFFTAIVPTIDVFNLPVFLFVTPMFLFSGTFFPVESLPVWGQKLALVFPLTHLVVIVRSLSFGAVGRELLRPLVYLACFSAVFFWLAVTRMRHRLIK